MAISSGTSKVDYDNPLLEYTGNTDRILDDLGSQLLTAINPWDTGLVAVSDCDICATTGYARNRKQVLTEQIKISYNNIRGFYPDVQERMLVDTERKLLDNITRYLEKFVKFERIDDISGNGIIIRATLDPNDFPDEF